MDFNFQFPKQPQEVTAPTGLMRRTIRRTLTVHPGGALVVWTGESGMGKTTTARVMKQKADERYEPENPDAFRIVHYEVGEITSWSGREGKKGIRSLYHAALGPLDEGLYRQSPAEDLAAQLIRGLRRKNIRMIIVDEAGLLSIKAIRGMVLVRDTAENLGWTLTIVFIGMDDLPTKLVKNPQIERRIHEWCYFDEYKLADTWALLQALHPRFAALDHRNSRHAEMVEFLHAMYAGKPGFIVPFLRKLDQRLSEDDEMDMIQLRAVHLRTIDDQAKALGAARDGFRQRPPERTGEDNSAGTKGQGKAKKPGKQPRKDGGKGKPQDEADTNPDEKGKPEDEAGTNPDQSDEAAA